MLVLPVLVLPTLVLLMLVLVLPTLVLPMLVLPMLVLPMLQLPIWILHVAIFNSACIYYTVYRIYNILNAGIYIVKTSFRCYFFENCALLYVNNY